MVSWAGVWDWGSSSEKDTFWGNATVWRVSRGNGWRTLNRDGYSSPDRRPCSFGVVGWDHKRHTLHLVGTHARGLGIILDTLMEQAEALLKWRL